jgi:hypothetical protein
LATPIIPSDEYTDKKYSEQNAISFKSMNTVEHVKQLIAAIEALLPVLVQATRLITRVLQLRLSPPLSYENLSLDFTVDLKDPAGSRALIRRSQHVRFLTGEAGVLTNPIWGEGDIARRYKATGATRIGSRREGHRQVVLLGLTERPTHHSTRMVRSERTVRGGFLRDREYFEIGIERKTRRVAVRVLFPVSRPPIDATVLGPSGEAVATIIPRLDRNGRAVLSWSTRAPQPNTLYSLRWSW